jgi:HEAT repeat protein
MKENISPENALSIFVESSIEHRNATENGDYRRANKAYSSVIKSMKILKEDGETDEFLKLLNHESPSVRLSSACALLSTFETEALRVLGELKNDPGLVSVAAQYTILEWEKGNLSLFDESLTKRKPDR